MTSESETHEIGSFRPMRRESEWDSHAAVALTLKRKMTLERCAPALGDA